MQIYESYGLWPGTKCGLFVLQFMTCSLCVAPTLTRGRGMETSNSNARVEIGI